MAADVLLTGGTVIDGTGAAPRRDEAVLLSDGRIAALGAQATTAATDRDDVERIDARGRVPADPRLRAVGQSAGQAGEGMTGRLGPPPSLR